MRRRGMFGLWGLLCAAALSGCAADNKPELAPIPGPVQVRIERQPIDGGLLTCAPEPAFDPAAIADDLDLLGLLYRFRDAGADCRNKLGWIREEMARPIVPPAGR